MRFYLFFCLALTSLISSAQKKYAILVMGDMSGKCIPIEEQFNLGQGKNSRGYQEAIWNDGCLLYKYLTSDSVGYDKSDVFVLNYDGNDYHPSGYAQEYSFNDESMTDMPATHQNLSNLLTDLSLGTNGRPQITKDDFLFMWVFSHGGHDILGNTFFTLTCGDGEHHRFYDYELKPLIDRINANKKVFWMQQCHSGGFQEELSNNNSIFLASTKYGEVARNCDDRLKDGTQFIEQEIIDMEVYEHAEFNFHLLSSLRGTTTNGEFYYGGELLSVADINKDKVVSVFENYLWEKNHESIDINDGTGHPGEEPVFTDYGNIATNTALTYPTILSSDINNDLTACGIIAISKDVHVKSGATLTFHSNAIISLLDNAKLIIDEEANIIVGNNVKITNSKNNKIIFNGTFSLGENIAFNSKKEDNFLEININNNSNINLSKVEFNNCEINIAQADSIKFNYCIFNNSLLPYLNGNITFLNSQINETNINIKSTGKDESFIFRGNKVNNSQNNAGICIEEYGSYIISDNIISATNNVGISIFNSGHSYSYRSIISNNTVHNSQIGINIYNTKGRILDNKVYNNNIGVRLFNISNISFIGSKVATNNGQIIKNNASYEVIVSGNSFPTPFKYNKIFDEYHSDTPLLFYTYLHSINDSTSKKIDITNNYWGSTFNPMTNLFPHNIFEYAPIWEPLSTANENIDMVELEFISAQEKAFNGSYDTANDMFRSIIASHPNSKYAQAAMKELIILEEFVSNNYEELQSYYLSINNESLLGLADNLANKCNEKLENWQQAIDWYEEKIANPATLEDSVFAVIDLGYLYHKINNNIRGKSQHNSVKESSMINNNFESTRDSLLLFLSSQNNISAQGYNRIKSQCLPITNTTTAIENNKVIVSWTYPEKIILAQSFNSGTLPDEWLTIDADEDGYNWDTTTGFTGHNGAYCISSSSYISGNWLNPDNYLISPILEDAKLLEYWVSNQDAPAREYYAVCSSTTGNETSDFSIIFEELTPSKSKQDKNPGEWYKRSILLPEGSKYIAFRHFDSTDQFWLNIDEVVVKSETNTANNDFLGYNVYRDSELIAEIRDIDKLFFVDEINNDKITAEYCVTAVYNDCESESICSTIEYNNISNNNADTNLKVYPNPVSHTLHINGLHEGNSIIELFTTTGVSVIRKEVKTSNVELDISGLEKGIYLLRISNSKQIQTSKLEVM